MKITGRENLNTVEKLYDILKFMVETGRKDYIVQVDNADYTYEFINEIRFSDETKTLIID